MDSSSSIRDGHIDSSLNSGEAMIAEDGTLGSQSDNSTDSKVDSIEIDSGRRRQLGDGKVAHSQIDSLGTDRSRSRQLGGGEAALLPSKLESAPSRHSPISTAGNWGGGRRGC